MIPYRYFRKIHPSWPAKLGDVVGRAVKVERDIVTRGNRTFSVGTKMYVTGTWRGGLELALDPKGMTMVRQVPPEYLTLVR